MRQHTRQLIYANDNDNKRTTPANKSKPKMNRSQESPSLKRKRPEPNTHAQSPESVLLNLIKSKGDMGIWKGDMKRETNLPEPVVNKALKTLQGKALIKEVVNIKSKGRKHFMAAEFEPSKELTGGAWYVEGKLDQEFIAVLKDSCSKIIRKLKVVTAEGISDFIKRNKITTIECKTHQIEEILKSMVLDNEIFEVKSTGLGEYHSIPIGTACYRSSTGMGLGQGPKIGAMASIPCGTSLSLSRNNQQRKRERVLEKMNKFSMLFFFFVTLILISSPQATARSSIILKPQSLPSFALNISQSSSASCSYTVTIRTSCSSPRYTRDQISLSFGDAYGYQVYAPRLDDPSTRTFERCSVDTYQIYGPCLYQVCYLYLYRSGYDGWKPESVQVYGYYTGTVSFYYNTYIPNNVWYGFNYCSGASASTSASTSAMKWFGRVFQMLFCVECWKVFVFADAESLLALSLSLSYIFKFLKRISMGEVRDNEAYEEELLDYEEDDDKAPDSVNGKPTAESAKKGYVGIHSSGFRDFLLKPELLRAIVDSGFEHPSEVQHECIPQAILGMDVICQAKSGMGKTAVFVLSTLQQIEPVAGQVAALVLCHTRELAYQICHEFERFSTYLPDIKVAVFYGGVNIKVHKDLLKNECPHIVVGTPGRILALARDKDLGLKNVRHFILDECDKMLESLDMRRDVQEIFKMTPHDKQVMMFSATLSKDIRPVCKKFMQDPMEIYVDDEAKLTLHGLVQHYIKLSELEKNRKLNDLLDALDFNQVVIFVKSVSRAAELNKLLVECNFPSICIHSGMSQEERLTRYKGFKEGHKRILVATDLVGRGIDIERVNIVINYDMPDSADTYLHRVGRAGRFGTKGLAITFVSSASDSDVLNQVQERFEVDIKELPEQIDTSTYMPS
ncbi:hypothetical protein ACSBR2_023486 [Camellia fascicularis]